MANVVIRSDKGNSSEDLPVGSGLLFVSNLKGSGRNRDIVVVWTFDQPCQAKFTQRPLLKLSGVSCVEPLLIEQIDWWNTPVNLGRLQLERYGSKQSQRFFRQIRCQRRIEGDM